MSDLMLYLICAAVGVVVVGVPVWYLFRVQTGINAERATEAKPATTPTRQRRLTRPNTVTRRTMQRKLREQARTHQAALAKERTDWALFCALVVLANQPRPVDERRPYAGSDERSASAYARKVQRENAERARAAAQQVVGEAL